MPPLHALVGKEREYIYKQSGTSLVNPPTPKIYGIYFIKQMKCDFQERLVYKARGNTYKWLFRHDKPILNLSWADVTTVNK